MNLLSNLTIKNLKLNKIRTIVTLVGIILSTALLVALTGLASSFLYTMEALEIESSGQQHVVFLNVPKEDLSSIQLHKETQHYYRMECLDYFFYGDETEVESAILAFDENALLENENKLTEGRLPENTDEILLSSDSIYKDVKIGDDFTLPDGKTYTVVGKIEDTKAIVYSYPIILYMEEVRESASIAVTYKHPENYEEITASIVGENTNYIYNYNTNLLRWQANTMAPKNLLMIYTMAGIVALIIMITAVFCIRNSFAISITEKIRQYGMLASVGATPKQIRKNVLFEAFILGIIGIPIGVLGGFFALWSLVKISNILLTGALNDDAYLILYMNAIYTSIGILLSALTIYLSAISSAIRASNISEIDAIRSSNDIKMKAKQVKTPKYIEKLFKIGGVFAYKNMKRNKRKFRTTTISLIVSIASFISLSAFLDLGFQMTESQYTALNYNILISNVNNEEIYPDISQMEGILNTNYIIQYPAFYVIGDDENSFGYMGVYLTKMDDEYYNEYLKENEIEYSQDTIVLLDKFYVATTDNKVKIDHLVETGNTITVFIETDMNEKTDMGQETTFEFVYPQEWPLGLIENYDTGIIMSTSMFKKYAVDPGRIGWQYIYIDHENPYQFEEMLNQYKLENGLSFRIENLEEAKTTTDNILLLISIFLYGFITVIILVGLTNIFNSLSTNMNLRRKEFATLQSIGMTKNEFSKMITFECISYVLKSLFWGIPIGVFGFYGLYYASSLGTIEYVFHFPVKQILISAIVVFTIVYGIMKSSFEKISKQNVIETIRQENI